MGDGPSRHYISSAVVLTRPAAMDGVAALIAGMDGVEVHAAVGGKIVVVIEGASSGMLGDRLAQISVLDGVMAANMVFEHMETEEATGHDGHSDAA